MNTSALLKKCIDKIKAMKGNDAEIQYVLGILETLYDMQVPDNARLMHAGSSDSTARIPVNVSRPPVQPDRQMSEQEILDKQAQERLKNVQDVV